MRLRFHMTECGPLLDGNRLNHGKDETMAKKKANSIAERVNEVAPALMQTVRSRVGLKLAILGKSRAALCEEHGVAASAVSNYLNSDNMTIRSLVQLAEMLGVTAAWLLTPIESEQEEA